MRFVVDESVEIQIAQRLRRDGHEVECVTELAPGIGDEDVLSRNNRAEAILITADKDFGELVFRLGRVARGVLLVRLAGISNEAKASTVADAIRRHEKGLEDAFTVISHGQVRIRHLST